MVAMKIAGARPSSNDINSIFNFAEVLRFYVFGIAIFLAETGLHNSIEITVYL